MNKITGIQESSQIINKDNVQKNSADPTLFKKTLDGVLGTQNSASVESTSATGSLGEIRSVAPAITEGSSVSVGDQTEKLLDQLDQYIQNLGDPNKTLKEMEPAVKDMKMLADALMENVESEGAPDKKLKDIAEYSAMMANIEYLKFNRGDYL